MNFEDVATLLRPAIYHYCRRFLRDNDRAEDMTQETLIRAMGAWRDKIFENDEHVRAWFFVIARHCCLNERRTASRTIPMSVRDAMPSGEIRERGGEPYVEREVLARLEWEYIESLLARIPDSPRRVLLLNAIGFGEMATARILFLPYEDVISHLRCGRIALRTLADEEWVVWMSEKYLHSKSNNVK